MTFFDLIIMLLIMGGGFAGMIIALRTEIGFATERANDADAFEE